YLAVAGTSTKLLQLVVWQTLKVRSCPTVGGTDALLPVLPRLNMAAVGERESACSMARSRAWNASLVRGARKAPSEGSISRGSSATRAGAPSLASSTGAPVRR